MNSPKFVTYDAFCAALSIAASTFVRNSPQHLRRSLWQLLRRFIKSPANDSPLATTIYFTHRSTHSVVKGAQLLSLSLHAELLRHSIIAIEHALSRTLTFDNQAVDQVYGKLDTYMVAGYISARVFARIAAAAPRSYFDPNLSVHLTSKQSIDRSGPLSVEMRLHSDWIQQMALARCAEVRDRAENTKTDAYYNNHRPLQFAEWRLRTLERTSALFEAAACLGAQSERFRTFGRLLGIAYAADYDIKAVNEAPTYDDKSPGSLRHGILSVPAAMAHRADPKFERMFLVPPAHLDTAAKAELLKTHRDFAQNAESELLPELVANVNDELDAVRPRAPYQLKTLVEQLVPKRMDRDQRVALRGAAA